jgi:hypothetical protein
VLAYSAPSNKRNAARGSSCGVMRNGNVAPPSTERYSSSSHHDKSMLGRTVFHSTLTCCPGYRTCPNVGESSLAAYLGPSAFDRCDNGGANARATANRTTTEVGICPSVKEPISGQEGRTASAFTMTFLSSEPLGHEPPRRNNVFLLKWESQFDCRPATDLALNRD